MTIHLFGWIVYGLAVAAFALWLYGLVWSRRTEAKRVARWEKRCDDYDATDPGEHVARLWWQSRRLRNREYQAALSITARRALNTHPERVAEMFSVRVTDTPLLKEVV